MSCPRCLVFSGRPCHSCRTLDRIRGILEGGKLLATQEGLVLAALRGAAGALTDLVEEASPILDSERLVSGFPPEDSQDSRAAVRHRTGDTSSVASGTGEKGELVKPKEEEPSEEEKEAVKSEKKEEKTPERARSSGRKPKKEKKVKEKKERAKAVSPVPKKRQKEESEEEEKRKDESYSAGSEEEKAPALELKPIPRGSAGKHFDRENDRGRSSGSAKPPEPVGPPPGTFHHGGSYWGRRERSRSKIRRGTKGVQHRERGRQPNWRPSWNQRR